MEKTGEAYETPDQQGALKLQYFLLATEMSRLVEDPRSPLKGEEPGQQLHLQDENAFLKNNYVNLKQRIDELSSMAMDYMLTPRGEELNYASNLTGDLSQRSYASKQKPSVAELLHLNKVIAGQNNTLIDHQPLLAKQMELLRIDIQQLNAFIINEGSLSQENRGLLVENLNKLIRMRFADQEEKMVQTENYSVTVSQAPEPPKSTESNDKFEKENMKLRNEIIGLEERISTQDQMLSLVREKMTPDARNIVGEISKAKLETEEARVVIVKSNNEKYELKKMVDQLKEAIRLKEMDQEESARKYKKGEAEFVSSIKDYERTIRGLKDELEESQKENKFLFKELEVMERELLNTRKNLTNAAIEIDEMEKAEQENLRKTKEIAKELTGKENEIEELKREMARNIGGFLNAQSPSKFLMAGRRSVVIQQEEDLEGLKEDNEALRRKVKEKQQEIFDLTLALDRARASKESPEKTDLGGSININELKRELSELNRQNNRQRDLLKEKEVKISDLEAILEGNKKEREMRFLDPGMPGMKASTASLDPDYKMKDLARQLDISRGREEELEKENEIMKLENKTLGKDIRNLEARYEEEVRDLKLMIEQGKDGYRSAYQTPVEMSNQKTSQKYKETIDILNEENEAFMKENFQLKKLIKQKDRQLEELIDKLEGSGVSVPKKSEEGNLISEQLKNKIIKLEKEKEDLVEQLMSQKMESSQVLQLDDNSLRVSLDKLRRELESSEKDLNQMGRKLKEKELECKEVRAEAEEYRKKLVESNESIASLKSQVKELQSRLSSTTDELNDLKIEYKQRTDFGNKASVDSYAKRSDEVEHREYIQKLKERINELELQVGDNYELKRLRNQISRLTQETEDLKLDHEEVSRRLKDKQSQNLKLMDEKESLMQQVKEQGRGREDTGRDTDLNSKSDFKIFRSNRNTEKEGQEPELGKDRSWAELQDLRKVMGKIKNTLGEDLSFPDHQVPQKIDGLIDDATINSKHVKSLQNENNELMEKLNRLLGKPNEEELQNTTLHERSKLNESYGFELEDMHRDVKQLREINRKLLEEKMNLESRLRRREQEEGDTSVASVSRMKESDADLDRMLDKFRKDREVYSKDAAILRERVAELQQQDNRSQQQIAGLEKYGKDLERALSLFFSDPVVSGITGVTNVELNRGKKAQFVDLLDDLAALLKKRQRSDRIERETLERELEELRVLGMTKRSEYIGKESLDDTLNASQNPIEQFEKELLKKTEELSRHKMQLQDLEFKYEDILKEVRRLKLLSQTQQSLLQLLSLDPESHSHLPKHELLCKIPEYVDLQQVVQDLLKQKSSSANLSSEGRSHERSEQYFDSEKGRINQMLGDYRRMEEQLSLARAQLEAKTQEIALLKNAVQEEKLRGETVQGKYSKMKKEVGSMESKIRELGGLSLEGKDALVKDNGKLKRLSQMFEERIKEVERENAELQEKYEQGMHAMKEKYERMKEKMMSHEEEKRSTHHDSIELLKKRIEELTALVVELRETNKILEEARRKDMNKNSDLRKKEDIIKEADGRLYAQRQRLQEKEKALESKEESLAELERELRHLGEEKQQAMGKSQVSQLENAGSVKELAGRLQALDIEGVFVGKQFLHGLRGNGTAAASLEAALQVIIKLLIEGQERDVLLEKLEGNLTGTTSKYKTLKETFMKLERENKTLYEELSAADDHLKTLQTEALRSNHHDSVNELTQQKTQMAEIIHKLTVENSRLNDVIDQMNEVKSPGPLRSRSANPSNASITPKRKQSGHLGGHLVDEDEEYSVSVPRRNASRMDILEGVDGEGRHLRTETSQDRSRGGSRPKSELKGSYLKEIKIVDKENMRVNGPGEPSQVPEMKGKMNGFFSLWSQVSELVKDFNSLGKQYEKVNVQIEKDRKRMDQLSQKKADLLPYMKEISRILANPNPESLKKNLAELEEAEAENINKSTRYFEKLLEEFGFLFNTMNDKLKVKKADYVKWNKKLAGYCQANYPQLHN